MQNKFWGLVYTSCIQGKGGGCRNILEYKKGKTDEQYRFSFFCIADILSRLSQIHGKMAAENIWRFAVSFAEQFDKMTAVAESGCFSDL